MRKQLDPRIPILINNNVKKNHRSFIVLVGDKGRDQIVNLHFLLSQSRVSARPSVLWCYKKELGFTSHRKKREAKIKRDVKRGVREANDQNPFEIFVTVTDIRYTYYKESQKILGHTYGMLVLQDFEAITPNLLARTIETVEGGGLVVLLLKTMTSLKQLYTMTMDVHARYRTASHDAVTARFNERFILSLGSCPDCLVLDDELNVLPISRGKDITPLPASFSPPSSSTQHELTELRASLASTPPAGALLALAATLDQAQAVLTFIDAIASKTLSSTVTLTAARGRGKSAALGLGCAAALAHGYGNVYVTSPTPENLKTFFEFVFKGMDALGYEEHLDYDIRQGGEEVGNAVVRVDVFKGHRQTIQYIQPEDAHVLGQAELVIIDEAAAIPLPLVRNLIGPYLVFLASTINGYEGTGRSLSLKLIQQLRESTRSLTSSLPASDPSDTTAAAASSSGAKKPQIKAAPKARELREIKLDTPIRYAAGDQIEQWLNGLLCLSPPLPARISSATSSSCPHPSVCELFHVSRDTLFSYHPASELFLQRMMALYVAAHYKNSPNDLQMLSDAPAHQIFVLLPPIKDDEGRLPEPLVVLQVAMEGRLEGGDAGGRGEGKGGDLIPWLVSQQFQEGRFAALSGARVVRVACHPDYANMGYGSRALQALNSFFAGEYMNLDEEPPAGGREETEYPDATAIDPSSSLLTETPSVRAPSAMPPLLQRLTERKPERLDYLGVSYGLTPALLRFWKRAGYVPLYVRQTTSELTGEHTCVMVRGVGSAGGEVGWLGEFAKDFRRRFLTLLSYKFREFGSITALSIIDGANAGIKSPNMSPNYLTPQELSFLFTPFDLKRLEAYANNMLDYHVILDLLPKLAGLFFEKRLGTPGEGDADGGVNGAQELHLTNVQGAILLALGLQRKTIEDVEAELKLPVSQTLALFTKIIRKLSKRLFDIQKAAIAATIPHASAAALSGPLGGSGSRVEEEKGEEIVGGEMNMGRGMEVELEKAGREVEKGMKVRERQREMLDALDLKKYAINDAAADWTHAEAQVASTRAGKSTVVSVKATSSGATAQVGQKRKSGAEEGQKSGGGGGEKKATRRSKKVKR